jgi:hypothetical protein
MVWLERDGRLVNGRAVVVGICVVGRMLLGRAVVDGRRKSEVEYMSDQDCWVELGDFNMSQGVSGLWLKMTGLLVDVGLALVAGRRVTGGTDGTT